MAFRRLLRPIAGTLVIISAVLPWYMRVDPGPSLTLFNFLTSWSQVSPIQISSLVLIGGAIMTIFSDEGVSILALGFICTVLVMESYRIYDLQQNLDWGLGFYLATLAIMICSLDILLSIRLRHTPSKIASVASHRVKGQEEH